MTMRYMTIKDMSSFVLALMLASVLATVMVVAGALTFATGFVGFIYNVFAVLIASIIPAVTGIYLGL